MNTYLSFYHQPDCLKSLTGNYRIFRIWFFWYLDGLANQFCRSLRWSFETNHVVAKILPSHKHWHRKRLFNDGSVDFLAWEIPKFEPFFIYYLHQRFSLMRGHLQILYLVNRGDNEGKSGTSDWSQNVLA